MTEKPPTNKDLRRHGAVIDQRQQRMDPTGTQGGGASDAGPKRSQKQPGQDPRDPQDKATDAE